MIGFDQLTAGLHFEDNAANHPASDCLWKLRPVLEMMGTAFLTVYTPDQVITVDETFWETQLCDLQPEQEGTLRTECLQAVPL